MSSATIPPYAPPTGRSSVDDLSALREAVRREPLLLDVLDAFPGPAMLLDENRQIILSNGKTSALLDRAPDALLGLRPGEALGCRHAGVKDGCGTSPECRYCGAALALHATLSTGTDASRECLVSRMPGTDCNAIDLRVSASVVRVGGEHVVVFALRDITDEKRRAVLERMFFHDVLNAAGGLRGLLEIWPELDGEAARETGALASRIARQLVEEIESQRDLAAAERGDLAVRVEVVAVAEILRRLYATYAHHTVGEGRTLTFESVAEDVRVRTDPRLLLRVLGNLVKNALEASRPGERVTVAFTAEPAPAFHVHNAIVLTEDVRAQLFSRSFSTKGEPGRGVGTYSARLLTERYLEGQISFRSNEVEGTTFTVTLR